MADKAHRAVAGRGDIMQDGPERLPISEEMQKKLQGTPWLQGDRFHRVVLSSNGNLDALMSVWYNNNVETVVLRDALGDVAPVETDFEWTQLQQCERKVQLRTIAGIFCVSTCRVLLRRQDAVDAVLSRRVGMDQLFHHFRILPRFRLVDAGVVQLDDGKESLWREYSLFGAGIECRVREDFRPNFLKLNGDVNGASKVNGSAHPPTKRWKGPVQFSAFGFGNVLFGDERLRVFTEVKVAQHPLQRALLSAAGNVARIVSSYHLHEVSLNVLRVLRIQQQPPIFEREVLMTCKGCVFGRAVSSVTIDDDNIIEKIERGLSSAPGALFRHFDCLPSLALHEVKLQDSPIAGFGRRYALTGPGIKCEIQEEFAMISLHLSDLEDMIPLNLAGIPKLW